MTEIKSFIQGVEIIKKNQIVDDRGVILHMLRVDDKNYKKFDMKGNVRNFSELQDYFLENYMLKSSKKVIKRTELSQKEKLSIALEYFIFTNNQNMKNNFGYFGRNKK